MNDQEIFSYIETLIQRIMAKVPEAERADKEPLLRDHLYNIALASVVENLSLEDLEQLKATDTKDQALSAKMEEMGATVPGLAGLLQETLDKEAKLIESTLEE